MRAPAIVVRHEKRMLKAAVEDLVGDADIEEIVSSVGAGAFATFFNYIAGTGIASAAVNAAGDSFGT